VQLARGIARYAGFAAAARGCSFIEVGIASRLVSCIGSGIVGGLLRFEGFERQFQLFDLAFDLLVTATELLPA